MHAKPAWISGSRSASAEKTPTRYSFWRGVATDTLLPLAVYSGATHLLGWREVPALVLTGAIPLVDCIISYWRSRRVSPVGVVVLIGVACSLAAMLLGGGAKVLLLRESLFTAVLGVACLLSIPTRRPLMFYFTRYFAAGGDPKEIESFNQGLSRPGFVSAMRVITAVWGAAFLLEFTVRAVLVIYGSTVMVLVVSPLLMNGIIAAAIAWNIWYGKRRKRARAEASAQEVDAAQA